MRLLNHKNIVKLYEVIDTPDELYLIMEYVSGGEIFDYLVAHGRMKEKDARKHFRQIVGAVAYCHSLHIIHRDLKAENLLLDENMNVKIADFGFSNQFSPGQKLNTWCGSPPYAAPELFQGKEYSGPEVDVWSLGVVLYVFVCGSLPFDGSNLAKLRARVIAGKFQIPFYMSPGTSLFYIIYSNKIDCEKLIKKMLTIDSTKRITMDQVMQDKWYMEGCENEPPQITSAAQTPVLTAEQQKGVLDELEELGLERDLVLKSINEGLYDSYTATYYLIADRRANGIPKATPTAKPPAPPLDKKKQNTSKAGMLEVLDEDEDPDNPKPKPAAAPAKEQQQQQVKAEETKAVQSSQDPPRVVTGGRRRAQTTSADQPQQQPVQAQQPGDLPPPSVRGGSAKPKVPEEFTQKTGAMLDQKASFPPEQVSALPPIPSAPAPQARARAHTIAVNQKDDEEQMIPIEQIRAQLKTDEQPRTARFTFSVSTTSTKDPPQVFEIVKKALTEAQVKVTTAGMVATCKLNDVEFEIEVCKLPNLQVVGLRCKRLGGDAWAYKEILSSLIPTMNL